MILGIETSGMNTGVAIIKEGKVLYEVSLYTKARHNETIYELLSTGLKSVGIKVKDLKGIAVSLGPGMFTSSRVGITLAKGLSFSLNIPAVGVNTLDALAYCISPSPWLIAPIIDAKKREVYTAFYKDSKRVSDYITISPEELIKRIKEPVMFLGNGLLKYGDILRKGLKGLFHSPKKNPLSPSPGIIGILGEEGLGKGEKESIEDLEPFYLRRTDAEIHRDKRDERVRP